MHNLKTAAMPMGMVVGVLLCRPIAVFESWSGNAITPALISMMLFFTFCRVDIGQMRPSWLHLWLLLFQLIGAVVAYYACIPFGHIIAQGAMVCVLAPIAMAAVVIGGMLGANIATMAAYSLICNFVIAVFAPLMLHAYGNGDCTFVQIAMKIAPLLIMPFVAGQACRRLFRGLAQWISDHSQISFYMWLISLTIVIGRTTCFILDTDADSGVEIRLAGTALIICLIQFAVGRRLGRRYGDTVAGGQSLGQKNTVLAVWMAQQFLDPVASVAPAAYIVWQNFVNSYQIYKKDSNAAKTQT